MDVILSEKSLYCTQNNIQFTCLADGKAFDFISATDLYSLFGNLLSNAIEAVLKIENEKKRIISLTAGYNNGVLQIHIENYYTGSLNFNDQLPATTKADASLHGFGLKSVQMLVEKYNGVLSVEHTDEVFYVDILFTGDFS